jgi:hypothetical protein
MRWWLVLGVALVVLWLAFDRLASKAIRYG